MKILHVGDMAGMASITANMCSRLGHESVVLVDDKTDIWDHGDHYKNTLHFKTTEELYESIRLVGSHYDHIVYHDRLDAAVKMDDLHVPASYMFHGNMLRQNPDLYHHIDSLESIDNLFVSTEDLLKYAPTAEYFHRPVDLDLFHLDRKIERVDMGICLTQKRYIELCNEMVKDAEHMVLVADRVENVRPYKDMPAFLNSFKYYYDIKFQPTHPPMVIPELSHTALQALACGNPVWSNGIWFTKFPEIHSDEWACKEFISVLEE